MSMRSAQKAAGIVVRLMFHVGGCCKMLDLRVRVESRLLSKKPFETRVYAKTCYNHVPPLHHNEGEKVDTLRLKEQVVCQLGGVITKI
jgi:hypothetical protein